MNDEKIYSQSDLNDAVTKAICDMQKVLERKDRELKIEHETIAMLADYCKHLQGVNNNE